MRHKRQKDYEHLTEKDSKLVRKKTGIVGNEIKQKKR
jgi:hypothetical protein